MRLTCFEADRRLLDLAMGVPSLRSLRSLRWLRARVRMQAHLVRCARCRRALAGHRDLLDAFPLEPSPRVPARLKEGTLDVLRLEGRTKRRTEGGFHVRIPAYAMGLLVALGIGYGLVGSADLDTKIVPHPWKLADSTLQAPDSVFDGSSLDAPESTSLRPQRDDTLGVTEKGVLGDSGSRAGIENRPVSARRE